MNKIKTTICLILILALSVPGLADARFQAAFEACEDGCVDIDPRARALFECADAQTLKDLSCTATGIVLIGDPSDNWTRQAVNLCCALSERSGISLIWYAGEIEAGDLAADVRAYISKRGTSFANVSGSTALIEAIALSDARPLNGVIAFINKGGIIGAHVGTFEAAQTPEEDWNGALETIMGSMTGYAQILGTSPCPRHC